MRTHYDILGIPPDADLDRIKAAYREKVKRCHPDRLGRAGTAPFREVHEAYSVLADPERRARYDRELGRASRNEPRRRSARAESLRCRDVPPAVAPDFSGRPHRPGYSDLSSGRRRYAVRVRLSAARVRAGGEIRVIVPIRETCPACGGRGAVWPGWCPFCGGWGERPAGVRVSVPVPAGRPLPYTLLVPLEPYGLPSVDLAVLCERPETLA